MEPKLCLEKNPPKAEAQPCSPPAAAARAVNPGPAVRQAGPARQTRQAARKSKAQQKQAGRVYVPKPQQPAAKTPQKATPTPSNQPRVFVAKSKPGSNGNGKAAKQKAAPQPQPTTKPSKKKRMVQLAAKGVVATGRFIFKASKAAVKKHRAYRQAKVAKKQQGLAQQQTQQAAQAKNGPPQIIIHQGKGAAPVAQGNGKPKQQKVVQPKQQKPVKQEPAQLNPAKQNPVQRKQVAQSNPKPQARPQSNPIAKSSPKPPPRPRAQQAAAVTVSTQPVARVVPPPPRPKPKRAIIPPSRPVLKAPPPAPKIINNPPPPRPIHQPRKKKRAEDDPCFERLLALDAFRGFVVLLLISGGLGVVETAARPEFAGSSLRYLAGMFQPVEWLGVSVWDLLPAAFMFMVGVSVPYSYAKRWESGNEWNQLLIHAACRAGILIVLGVAISSGLGGGTRWEFTNLLCQIGLGYLVVFLLWRQHPLLQVGYLSLLFVCYAGMFYYFHWMEAGAVMTQLDRAPSDFLPGLAAPFSQDLNFAAEFDRWFLNLFPRSEAFVTHPEGVHTLNFVPAIGTMMIGLMVGEMLQSEQREEAKFNKLLMAGAACLVLGVAAGITLVPIVARIWTPSWVLFSAAFVIWIFAAFYGVTEVLERRKWVMPLVVVGMNCLAAYLLFTLAGSFIVQTFQTHGATDMFSGELGPLFQHCALVIVIWLVCALAFQKRVFVRL
ncbi:MAG: hypothetical protein ACPGVU_10415 [Limisphaerales bacterium]